LSQDIFLSTRRITHQHKTPRAQMVLLVFRQRRIPLRSAFPLQVNPMSVAVSTEEILDIAKLREQDLEEARIIQDVMLPAHPLREGRVTISNAFQPMLEVGGDYLDYFTLSDGKVGLYIGDVSGKGLPAALYAALTVGTLRGVHKTGQPPSRVLSVLSPIELLGRVFGAIEKLTAGCRQWDDMTAAAFHLAPES
jgi:hypothetical protein